MQRYVIIIVFVSSDGLYEANSVLADLRVKKKRFSKNYYNRAHRSEVGIRFTFSVKTDGVSIATIMHNDISTIIKRRRTRL